MNAAERIVMAASPGHDKPYSLFREGKLVQDERGEEIRFYMSGEAVEWALEHFGH